MRISQDQSGTAKTGYKMANSKRFAERKFSFSRSEILPISFYLLTRHCLKARRAAGRKNGGMNSPTTTT